MEYLPNHKTTCKDGVVEFLVGSITQHSPAERPIEWAFGRPYSELLWPAAEKSVVSSFFFLQTSGF